MRRISPFVMRLFGCAALTEASIDFTPAYHDDFQNVAGAKSAMQLHRQDVLKAAQLRAPYIRREILWVNTRFCLHYEDGKFPAPDRWAAGSFLSNPVALWMHIYGDKQQKDAGQDSEHSSSGDGKTGDSSFVDSSVAEQKH